MKNGRLNILQFTKKVLVLGQSKIAIRMSSFLSIALFSLKIGEPRE